MPARRRTSQPNAPVTIAIVSTNGAHGCPWSARLSGLRDIAVAGHWPTLDEARQAGVRLDAIVLVLSRSVPAGEALLSAREAQVMSLLAGGCRDKELPARLGVTAHTARTYLRRAMAKLGAGSRAEAVGRWSRNGGTR